MNKRNILAFCLILLGCAAASAETLTLDSCRAMALRNNKQLSISRMQEEVARNVRKSAKTKYLPHIDLGAAYMLTSREASILNNAQKAFLSNLGTNAIGLADQHTSITEAMIGRLAEKNIIKPEEIQKIQQLATATKQQMAAYGNALGEKIEEAFRTDTRNVFVGSIMLTQPIYMGGAISAGNNMAEISERLATDKTEAAQQNVLYEIDQAYWMVVSLNQKLRLADSYLNLVTKLDEDVQKMIKEGVATRADGLKVSVRVNEADMTKTQVESGLSLSKMLLCQLCGIPLDSDITLADENADDIAQSNMDYTYSMETAFEYRPELRMLNDGVELSKEAIRLARAGYMPQIALTGGYTISNPNVFNGFEKKFGGLWNVGVMLRMSVFDWGDTKFKIRAAKASSNIAAMTLEEAKEKIELQVSQCDHKLQVARKKLNAAQKSIQQADENLRCANIGFKEGVMSTTEVMAAQTAWFMAQTQKIDAQIDVKLSETGIMKAMGMLSGN